jgi:hypothetical protein
MSGDILWFATALGKEGFAGWWCYCCQMFRLDWQSEDLEAWRTLDDSVLDPAF